MKSTAVVFGLTALLVMLCGVGQGSCALVVGTVRDVAGSPVQGVKIQAFDKSGTMVGEALSEANGAYSINGLKPGRYVFKVDPLATAYQPGDGVAYLSDSGLTINWTLSPGAVARADASVKARLRTSFA